MKIKIRSKLIFAISTLMVIVFSASAYLFIKEKRIELAQDIYHNTLTFARLTSSSIAYKYDLYLAQDGFVYFNRELQGIFEQNEDISKIKVVSYSGEILYDSSEDIDKKYDGEKRILEDEETKKQIKSENISIKTKQGFIAFLKKDIKGDYIYVNNEEQEIEAIEEGSKLEYLIVPATEKYSVIFYLDYSNLEERIDAMKTRIIYLAIFSIMLGMILSFGMSTQFTRPITKLVNSAKKIAKGRFKERTNIKTHDELRYLGQAFNKMAEDLEKSVENKLYKERVTHELELATEIQKQIIPKKIPTVNGLDIASGLIPAEEIGGDIYDFLSLNPDKIMMYLGDVTGHGVPAGIVSSIANALFYGYIEEKNIKNIIVKVNKVLHAKTMPNMFMTLCLMEWDAKTDKFTYVNAGHDQIIHYKAINGTIGMSESGGIALGMLPDINNHVKEQEINLKKDDFIVIYSDGIPEAWKNKKENYGMERLKKIIEKSGNLKTAKEIKKTILKDVSEFCSGYKQQDDITIIIAKKTI